VKIEKAEFCVALPKEEIDVAHPAKALFLNIGDNAGILVRMCSADVGSAVARQVDRNQYPDSPMGLLAGATERPIEKILGPIGGDEDRHIPIVRIVPPSLEKRQ